jgi:hypothetical protein
LALSPVGSAEANFWGFTNEGRPMIVKFTGKERDVETGVDYFGARRLPDRGNPQLFANLSCAPIVYLIVARDWGLVPGRAGMNRVAAPFSGQRATIPLQMVDELMPL